MILPTSPFLLGVKYYDYVDFRKFSMDNIMYWNGSRILYIEGRI